MSLTGWPLLVVLAVAWVVLSVLLLWGWQRIPARAGGVLIRLAGLLLVQAVLLSATFVGVNRIYGFYTDWGDLLGQDTDTSAITVAETGLVPADGSLGATRFLTIHGKASGATGQVMVWTPPGYDPRRAEKYPVLMVLPGQPGSPSGIFQTLDFATQAVAAIKDHAVPGPFIAVLPPLMTDPPRDTECTDVPHGPRANTWLASDLHEALTPRFDITPDHWSVLGWSTGGFCAAKLVVQHPTSFSSAVSFGGYLTAETDHTTGNLFNGSRTLKDQNSPVWLIRHTLNTPVRLLVVVSKQDKDSWHGASYADTSRSLPLIEQIPGISSIVLPEGGHNFHTYDQTLPATLQWLGRNGL